MSLLTRWWTTFFVASLDSDDPAEALFRRPPRVQKFTRETGQGRVDGLRDVVFVDGLAGEQCSEVQRCDDQFEGRGRVEIGRDLASVLGAGDHRAGEVEPGRPEPRA